MDDVSHKELSFRLGNCQPMIKLSRFIKLIDYSDEILQFSVSTLAIAFCTYLSWVGSTLINQEAAIAVYFVTIYLLACRFKLLPVIWATILSAVLFDIFIVPPALGFSAKILSHIIMFSLMLLVFLPASRRTAQIESYSQELERKVLIRTEELAKLNQNLIEEIQKHKITEEKLKRTVDELARSNAMLQQFARIASHDLQEPLRVLQGYVELLSLRYEKKLDAKGLEFLKFINEASLRMEKLVKGVLQQASINYDTRQFEMVNIEDALRDACANLQQRIKETNTELSWNSLPSMRVNRVQFVQLFQNLISNAIKFQNKNITPKININCEKRIDEYIFSVSDNGIGIEDEYKEQIFGMFKRLHSLREFPGSGLGLAICKAILDKHDGKIWVESVVGEGSKFFFSVPALA